MNPNVKLLQSQDVNHALETLNPRERRYVLQVTLGRMSKAEAANDSGFAAPPTGLAVTNAVAVIQRKMSEALVIDFNHVAVGLQDAIELARAKGEPMSMIAGYREQAKLAGLMIEKKQVDVNVKHISEEDLAEMSEDELNQLIDKADAIELTHAEYERLPEG
jgi:hypothetical protein